MNPNGPPPSSLPRPSQSELDELDLLEETLTPGLSNRLKDQVLSATDAFQSRFDRTKKKAEETTLEQRRARRHRATKLLQAFSSIRHSLRDVCRLEFDANHSLHLVEDDWQGWPRLCLRLRNSELPEKEFPPLRIIAQDTSGVSLVEISTPSEKQPSLIPLTSDSDLIRLTSVLRKSVRQFLDFIGETLIEEKLSTQEGILPTQGSEFTTLNPGTVTQDRLSADLFSEDALKTDHLEALPSISEIETLPIQPRQLLKT